MVFFFLFSILPALTKNTYTGRGVFTSIDGDLYRGGWKNDEQDGRGVYVWPDGQMFTGDYVHGIREGKGYVVLVVLTFRSGGKKNEKALSTIQMLYILITHSITLFLSLFRCFLFRAFYSTRIETWPSGARFEGEYKDDQRNGHGTYWYADGRCHKGEYKDDVMIVKDDHLRNNSTTSSEGTMLTEWRSGEFIKG